MAKTNAEKQKLYRENLLKNKSKYDQMRKISRIRDNKRKKVERINNKQSSSYKSHQSFGKTVKRVLQSLPKDIHKCVSVVHHIAQEFNIIPKTTSHHQREQHSLSIELKQLVMNFYSQDDISYHLREAHQLFLIEHDHTDAYLSLGSFSDLRPS
ncbi:unnamed protein product, partial [Rotaria sp. Silwood2]